MYRQSEKILLSSDMFFYIFRAVLSGWPPCPQTEGWDGPDGRFPESMVRRYIDIYCFLGREVILTSLWGAGVVGADGRR